ncbi:hypothetical protein [Burkholderia ubonensis]|uniref:hypothetical protein n=1 Tax=Burkholderia ubonensis TaxID=101571 RepID=UPI000753818A|nr:hypothetical protein [Burkholderia ubonensis]
MALVNFYNKTPSDTQIASDLSNDELVVFTHPTSAERDLAPQVEALVDFEFNTHHTTTLPNWNGDAYFVMVRSDFDYAVKREKLRALAVDWVDAGYPNQVKHV